MTPLEAKVERMIYNFEPTTDFFLRESKYLYLKKDEDFDFEMYWKGNKIFYFSKNTKDLHLEMVTPYDIPRERKKHQVGG